MLRILLLFSLVIISQQLTAQFRSNYRDYPNNYVDSGGRKQGLWIIKDADSLLINKIRYRNNVVDSTVYFKKSGESIYLLEPDSNAYPINNNSSVYMSITLECLKIGCTAAVSFLIEPSGQVTEIRFVNRCSKKIEKKARKYLNSLVFMPARLNGENIISQAIFKFGKAF
jgi:hypothetical protein